MSKCSRCLNVSVDSVIVTKCGHIFCPACLCQWLAAEPGLRQPCPVCKGVQKRYMSINTICNGGRHSSEPGLQGSKPLVEGRPIPPAVPFASRRPRAVAALDSHAEENSVSRPHRSLESLLASRSEGETRKGLASPPRRSDVAVETLSLPHQVHEYGQEQKPVRGLALPLDPLTALLNHQGTAEGGRHDSSRTQRFEIREGRIRTPPFTSRVRRRSRQNRVMSSHREQVTDVEAHAKGPSTPRRPTARRDSKGDEHANPLTVQLPSEVLVYYEGDGAPHEHSETLKRSKLSSTGHSFDNVASRALPRRLPSAQWRELIEGLRGPGFWRSRPSGRPLQDLPNSRPHRRQKTLAHGAKRCPATGPLVTPDTEALQIRRRGFDAEKSPAGNQTVEIQVPPASSLMKSFQSGVRRQLSHQVFV